MQCHRTLRKEDGLAEAGRLLKVLELRAAESVDKTEVAFVPNLSDSCRYLRAVYCALSGNWKQARGELIALRDREVLVQAVRHALEAFPTGPLESR